MKSNSKTAAKSMDSSTSTTVLITPRSKSVIFDGNLLKAPPLNRRGRKKWHERYFVLRSNKTLECHKSKKATEAMRSPRRIIDLRECINLEIGLEYKNLQHILSLGTFKRTFFFAAPSDALMLQWANVLEKVKNAEEGESIEVLDIGLRKSREHRAVHRVKPSPSAHRFSIGSPNRTNVYKSGSSKSSITLSHFAALDSSAETINLRDSQESSAELSPGGMRTGNAIPLSGVGNAPTWKGYGTAYFGMGMGTENETSASEMGDVSSVFGSPVSVNKRSSLVSLTLKPEPPKDQDVGVSPSIPEQPSVDSSPWGPEGEAMNASTRAGYIPTRVPPPMLATRGKESGSRGHEQTDSGSLRKTDKPNEFIEKEGQLRRGRAYKSNNSNPKLKRTDTPKSKQPGAQSPTQSLEPPATGSLADDSAAAVHSNMKRSFRYRKITLRAEKPLFDTPQQDENSSDEEADTESEAGTRPGSKADITLGNETGTKIGKGNPSTAIVSSEQVGPTFSLNTSSPMKRKFVPLKGDSDEGGRVTRVLCRARANSYSKVSVGSLKDREMLADISSRNKGTVGPKLSEMITRTAGSETEESRAQGPSLQDDAAFPPATPESFQLPALPPDSMLYSSMNSLNSLDNILVDPPTMFDPGSELAAAAEGGAGGGDVRVHSHDPAAENGQSNERRSSPSNSSPLAADRNSTESNDTGYTSGASPSYQERRKLSIPEFDETGSGTGTETETESELRNLPTPQQEVLVDIKQSQTSTTSSDSVRCYVPMVFYCPTVSRNTRLFAVQVCLVENSDELLKDLVALKGLENYRLVECEDQHGSNVTAFGDDFTVATALEDLEFGFNVVTNTQKDLFMRRVRQFQFEIQDLFGCPQKPFSCDVEIRHSDQMTVLPIEVQRV